MYAENLSQNNKEVNQTSSVLHAVEKRTIGETTRKGGIEQKKNRKRRTRGKIGTPAQISLRMVTNVFVLLVYKKRWDFDRWYAKGEYNVV